MLGSRICGYDAYCLELFATLNRCKFYHSFMCSLERHLKIYLYSTRLTLSSYTTFHLWFLSVQLSDKAQQDV